MQNVRTTPSGMVVVRATACHCACVEWVGRSGVSSSAPFPARGTSVHVRVHVLRAGRPRRRRLPGGRRAHRRKDRRPSGGRTGRPQMSVGGGASRVDRWRMCGGPRETKMARGTGVSSGGHWRQDPAPRMRSHTGVLSTSAPERCGCWTNQRAVG